MSLRVDRPRWSPPRCGWRCVALAVLLLGLVAAGCRHRCCLSGLREPRPYLPPPPRSPYLLPPAQVPTIPAPGTDSVVPPVAPPGEVRQYAPPTGPSWLAPPAAPAPNGNGRPAPEILLPDPLPPGNGPTAGSTPHAAATPGRPASPVTAGPPPAAATDSPHLPGYARVLQGVASGRRPSLAGFDALQRAGFRTLLYLHGPQADLAAIRSQAAQRQLALVAIETTPENLPQAIEQFQAVVGDTARHPIYVCDEDGLRCGVLWYVYFRTIEALNDDAARVRARPLGFTTDAPEATPFLLAVQRYLANR